MSRSPRSENTDTTIALTSATAMPAWTNTWSLVAAPDGHDPGQPPRNTYAAISSDEPFTAPATIAMRAMTNVAIVASRRIVRSIPTAAVGRK